MNNPTSANQEIGFMFGGHGSQTYQMAKKHFDVCAVFRRWMLELDRYFVSVAGYSVIAELYAEENRIGKPFDDIRYSHPAIFMVEYAGACKMMEQGVKPDFVIGVSLGELTAAVIANAITWQEALNCIAQQSSLFSGPSLGGMTVVLDSAQNALQLRSAGGELAGINMPNNFVIAGNTAALANCEKLLQEHGTIFLRLPIAQPFHSSAIDSYKSDFAKTTPERFSEPSLSVFSASTAGVVDAYEAEFFWHSIRAPMNVLQTLTLMSARPVKELFDFSPAGTLKNFATALPQLDHATFTAPFGLAHQWSSSR